MYLSTSTLSSSPSTRHSARLALVASIIASCLAMASPQEAHAAPSHSQVSRDLEVITSASPTAVSSGLTLHSDFLEGAVSYRSRTTRTTRTRRTSRTRRVSRTRRASRGRTAYRGRSYRRSYRGSRGYGRRRTVVRHRAYRGGSVASSSSGFLTDVLIEDIFKTDFNG